MRRSGPCSSYALLRFKGGPFSIGSRQGSGNPISWDHRSPHCLFGTRMDILGVAPNSREKPELCCKRLRQFDTPSPLPSWPHPFVIGSPHLINGGRVRQRSRVSRYIPASHDQGRQFMRLPKKSGLSPPQSSTSGATGRATGQESILLRFFPRSTRRRWSVVGTNSSTGGVQFRL